MSNQPELDASKHAIETLSDEELEAVTGGSSDVTDTDGAIIGAAVGAKLIGVHTAVTAYKRGAKSAIPLHEGGVKGGKGALIGGVAGAVEGAVAGGITGFVGVHVERTIKQSLKNHQ